MSTLESEMLDIGRRARAAAKALRLAPAEARTAAINAMAQRLRVRTAKIASINESDVAAAHSKSLDAAQIDRLRLDEGRTLAVADGVAAIEDGAHDAGVGARAADAFFFERFDEGCLGVARGRFGLVAARVDGSASEDIALDELGKGGDDTLFVVIGLLVVGIDTVSLEVALEDK